MELWLVYDMLHQNTPLINKETKGNPFEPRP